MAAADLCCSCTCAQAHKCQYHGVFVEGSFAEGKWVHHDGTTLTGSFGGGAVPVRARRSGCCLLCSGCCLLLAAGPRQQLLQLLLLVTCCRPAAPAAACTPGRAQLVWRSDEDRRRQWGERLETPATDVHPVSCHSPGVAHGRRGHSEAPVCVMQVQA